MLILHTAFCAAVTATQVKSAEKNPANLNRRKFLTPLFSEKFTKTMKQK